MGGKYLQSYNSPDLVSTLVSYGDIDIIGELVTNISIGKVLNSQRIFVLRSCVLSI